MILWSKIEKFKQIFLNWWKNIEHKQRDNFTSKTSIIKWRHMLWNNKYKKNEHWNYFIEIARILNNKLQLFCCRCSWNIIHFISINTNSNDFINHWINEKYKCWTRNIFINKNIVTIFRNVNVNFEFMTNNYNKFVFTTIQIYFICFWFILFYRKQFHEMIDQHFNCFEHFFAWNEIFKICSFKVNVEIWHKIFQTHEIRQIDSSQNLF